MTETAWNKSKHAKWKGAAIGGLTCLLWSILVFFPLPASLYKVFLLFNFVILPFYIYVTCFLSVYFLDPKYTFDKATFLVTIINACGGALIGVYIGGFAKLDPSYLPLCMLGGAIAGAIPFPGIFFTVFIGLPLQIYFVIQYWPMISQPAPFASLPSPIPVLPLLFLASPSLLAIPGSALLGYETGGFIYVKLQKAKLTAIESRIKKLERIVEKHETILAQRDKLEQEISGIVALDPPNFGLKVTLFRTEAQALINEQIQRRIIEIDEEMQKTISWRRQVEEKLSALESEKEALERKFEEIQNKLHKMQLIDPANITIKLPKLRSEWESMNKQDLEKINTTGEIEQLFKEQLLLSFRVEAYDKEIESISKEVIRYGSRKITLALEKLVLQLEEMDRNIEREEPHLLEIQDELKRLHMDRDTRRETLESVKS